MVAQVHLAEQNKSKRLATRQDVLRKEHEMREGCDEAQSELDQVGAELEQFTAVKDQEMRSLQGVLDELEYKVTVATTECAKWTDNTLQVVQHVLQDTDM